MDAQVRNRLVAEIEGRFGVTIPSVVAGHCFAQAQRIFSSMKASGATKADLAKFEHGEHRPLVDSAARQVAAACAAIDNKTKIA